MDNENKMMPIFIVLRDGEALMPEVIKGIAKQTIECFIVPITSKGKFGKSFEKSSRINKRKNLLRAVEFAEDNFILMDSDVVMDDENIIKEMLDDSKNLGRGIIAVTTKNEKIKNCGNFIPHSLLLLKEKEIRNFKKFLLNLKEFKICSVCMFVQKNIDKVINLENSRIRECKRIDLNNRG